MILFNSAFKKRFDALKAENDELKAMLKSVIEAANNMQKFAHLISIERIERKVIFTFSIENRLEKVETIGTWADNIDEWKEKLNVR